MIWTCEGTLTLRFPDIRICESQTFVEVIGREVMVRETGMFVGVVVRETGILV